MLRTIQIIALIQGIFLLFLLLKNRAKYKKVTFWLFSLSILSILLFIIGDDDDNLFQANSDWYLFDTTLFVTFLFLFFRYFKSGKEKFQKKDLLFFVPNILYAFIEVIELNLNQDYLIVEIPELLIELVFLGYLTYILVDLIKNKNK